MILGKLNLAQYKYLDNKKSEGFVLGVQLFSKGKEAAYMIFSSDDVLRLSYARYKKTSGGFDIEELLSYIEE